MPAIETKEQLEKIKVAYKNMVEVKSRVAKMSTQLTDAAGALGNLIGMQSRDALKLEEEVRRLIGDAYLAGIHEKEAD